MNTKVLQYDDQKYTGVVEDKDGNAYAFEKATNVPFFTADDDQVFICLLIKADGHLDMSHPVELTKKELTPKLVRVDNRPR